MGVTKQAVPDRRAAGLGGGARADPYDPDARKVLELAFREALRLGHTYIGTEHIGLALLEHEAGSGVLSGVGVEKSAVQSCVAAALRNAAGGSPGQGQDRAADSSPAS